MGPSVSSRAVVGSLLAAIGVGPLLVDFVYKPTAKQHIHNPSWPPHAKFHDAQYIAMTPIVSAVGLRILFQRNGNPHAHLRQAAALAAAAWLGMWGALLLPGTAATDPEFESTEQKLFGLHPQLFMSLVALGGLSGTVAIDAIRARRGRRTTSD
ncbi:MAG: hypothetical protein QOH17_4751 [Pseudonocardiales bacterium]|nr:hypothetical protein [Pseudonocardiales bacterium]